MTTITQPYEILIRFQDGIAKGAHYKSITTYRDDDGNVITAKESDAQPIPTELSTALLGEVNAGLTARITELEAELATARNPANAPAPDTSIADTLARLNTVFASALTAETQSAFAAPYAIVRVLVQAGQNALAASVISGIEVPDELAEIKAQLIAILTPTPTPAELEITP